MYRRSLTGVARAARRGGKKPRREFRDALGEIGPPVSAAYKLGLQALSQPHRGLVSCADGRLLTGSIDLDSALRKDRPNAPRWDYAIGYRHGAAEHAVWIEVHGAQTGKVKEMIRKLDWLKDWLNADGQPLRRMTGTDDAVPAFVWLASGRLNLPPNSRQAKLARQKGIFPRKRLVLP